MSDQATNAVIAVALGSVVALVLLIPTAAVQYRRDGRLGPGDLSILLSGAVYGLALWTYTLLPLPPADEVVCRGRQVEPFASIRPIWAGDPDGPLGLLRDPAFLQVALNVLLFVPLGYFLRVVAHRGVVVAGLVGLATSLLIEVTQLTGDWGLYDCAYRLFDVDDLLVNTLGAVGGSLVSALFVDREPREVRLPTTLTLGRRLVGMVCDVLFAVLLGAVVALGYRAWQEYAAGSRPDTEVQVLLQLGVPFLAQAGCVLLLGRTVGEWTVDLRTVPAERASAVLRRLVLARVVKLALGVAPLFVLVLLGGAWVTLALPAYLLLTVLAAWRTPGHRGLSHTAAGLDLQVDREGVRMPRTRR